MPAKCSKCNDTGVIVTGNNDLPCTCEAGDTARFNSWNSDKQMTETVSGAQLKKELNYNSSTVVVPSLQSPPSKIPQDKKQITQSKCFWGVTVIDLTNEMNAFFKDYGRPIDIVQVTHFTSPHHNVIIFYNTEE
jgi:hypothetical protein